MKTSHKLASTALMLILLLGLAAYLSGYLKLPRGLEEQVASVEPTTMASRAPELARSPTSSAAAETSKPTTAPTTVVTSETSQTSPATFSEYPVVSKIPTAIPDFGKPSTLNPEVSSLPELKSNGPVSSEAASSPATPDSKPTQAQTQHEESTLATGGLVDPTAPTERELDAWHQFRYAYNRTYLSEEETRHRQSVFLANLRFISAFNEQRQAQYTLAVNQFADLTRDEINHLFVGPQVSWAQTLAQMQAPEPKSIRVLGANEAEPDAKLATIDLRNLLGSPMDQGRCLDSSVFAAVAALEAARQTATGGASSPIKLSERQLLDCLGTQQGVHPPPCLGFNSMLTVFEQLSRVPLLSLQAHAELQANLAGQPVCQSPDTLPTVRLSHYTTLHRDNIPDALANGDPLVVALDASHPTFHFYAGGLYHDIQCSPDTYNSHALLVGLEEAAYLARMSFGPHWGESGHIRLARDEQLNKCQPQHVAILPHVAPAI